MPGRFHFGIRRRDVGGEWTGIQIDSLAGATYAGNDARMLGEEHSYTKRVAVMINGGNYEIRIARINHAPALQNPCSSLAAQRNLHGDPWRA
jgi:hypothetical protein